jgi:hypothetical protein
MAVSFSAVAQTSPEATERPPFYGDYDFWIIRLDGDGNKLWDRSFGGSGFDVIYGLQQTTDGGYILGGISTSPPSGNKTSAPFGLIRFLGACVATPTAINSGTVATAGRAASFGAGRGRQRMAASS